MEAATAFREALCFSWSSYDFLNPSVLATANAVSMLASMIPVVLTAASVAGSAVDVLDVEELDVVLDSVPGACVLEDAVDELELDVEVPLVVLEADVDEDEDSLDVDSVVELLGVDVEDDELTEVEDDEVASEVDEDAVEVEVEVDEDAVEVEVEVKLVADVVEDDAEVVDDVDEEVLPDDVDESSGRTSAEAELVEVLVEVLEVLEDDVRVELSLACVIVMAAAKCPHAHAYVHANSTRFITKHCVGAAPASPERFAT